MAIRTESYKDIKNIMKQFQLYRRYTKKEIRLLNAKISKLQKIIEENIIQDDNPDEYESKAIKNFESKRI